MFRAGDGKTRIDYGNISVIANPAAQHAILLDHVKQEARPIPMPQPALPQMAAPQFAMPQFAPPGAAPQPPAVTVQDLGKSFIDGHEVEGKRYLIQPPAPPQAPPLPQPMAVAQAQGMAHMPGVPKQPALPQMPQPPQSPPITAEVWTSTQLKMPVLTKIAGPSGQQSCYCKAAPSAEPHPSLFQIPQGYHARTP